MCIFEESKGLMKNPRLRGPKGVLLPRDLTPALGVAKPRADSALPVRVKEPYKLEGFLKLEEFLKLEDGSGYSESERTRARERKNIHLLI